MPLRRNLCTRERGSALMLMPAAVLIVFVLGSIALDFSIIYLRQRQAVSLATDVANDAAIEAIAVDVFRDRGIVVLDPGRLEEIARRHESATTFADVTIDLAIGPSDESVTATVVVDFELVFAGLIPSAERHRRVEMRATALIDPGPSS